MVQLEKIDIDNWREKAISNFLMKGNTIDHIFPSQFEKYCKVFHPFEIVSRCESVINKASNWDECSAIIESTVSTCNEDHFVAQPVRLFAKLLNMPYDIHFESHNVFKMLDGQPDWLLFPVEGSLDKSTLHELTIILIESSVSQECYFYYVPYAIETYMETIYKGSIEEFPETINIGVAGSPSAIWPVSREWYVYSNYDADFTLIGGTEKMINRILSNNKIEALEWERSAVFYPDNR